MKTSLILTAATIFACVGCSASLDMPKNLNVSFGDQTIPIEASGPHGRENAEVAKRFLTAFARSDPRELAEIVTADFVWHLHAGEADFRGRTVKGTNGILQVKEERRNDWSKISYSNVRLYVVGNRIVQTYRVTGISRRSGAFDANGVDLYLVRHGRVAVKDSYWKQ